MTPHFSHHTQTHAQTPTGALHTALNFGILFDRGSPFWYATVESIAIGSRRGAG